jgi:archaellum component FlaG (FlaF/FlaG flagellin family)
MSTRISRETRFRCSIENTGNGVDDVNIMVGGQGLWGSLIQVPKGTHVGLSSVADHIDQKGDVAIWNTSRTLDPSQHPPNTLHIPQRILFGGQSVRGEPVQGFTIRLHPGEIMFMEFWLKQDTNEEGIPIEARDLLVAALTDDIRTILPVHVDLRYPDIYIVEDIQILGGSDGDPNSAREGDRLTFVVKVGNRGQVTAEDVTVQLFVDGEPITNITLPFIVVSETQQKIAILTWEAKEGKHDIRIELDPDGSIVELDDLETGSEEGDDRVVTRINVEGDGNFLTTGGVMVLSIFLLVVVMFGAGWVVIRKRLGPVERE